MGGNGSLLEQLEAAINDYRIADVERIERTILASVWAADPRHADADARAIVKALRRNRRFGALDRAASALLATGAAVPEVAHSLVQAALDLGDLEIAEARLARAGREHPKDQEFEGLRGRLAKQRYVNATAPGAVPGAGDVSSFLQQAFAHYAAAYNANHANVWHGINAVALAARAARDGVDLGAPFDVQATAKEILAGVDARVAAGVADGWDHATALECELALGHKGQVIARAIAYVADRACDGFAYASTLRQLREVWAVDEADPDLRLVTGLLEGKIVARKDGVRVEPPADVSKPPPAANAKKMMMDALGTDEAGLERNFGGTFTTYENYRHGLVCADSVGWVGRRRDQRAGSGVLVRGSLLSPKWKKELVFVTNAHVVDDGPGAKAQLRPDEAVVGFESGANKKRTFKVAKVLWRSPIAKLDTVVLRLSPAPKPAIIEDIARSHPSVAEDSYVYVLGYPEGGALKYSLNDNRLLDHDKRFLHYRTRTEPGSSGSPVFDPLWNLVAIHHKGSATMRRLNGHDGTYEANEGISILAIKQAL